MGANTGNRENMDAARRQQAMEGQAMRRRALQQQAQAAPTQEQGVAPEMSAPAGTGTHGSYRRHGPYARDAFWN
jgi:hypothetical protein